MNHLCQTWLYVYKNLLLGCNKSSVSYTWDNYTYISLKQHLLFFGSEVQTEHKSDGRDIFDKVVVRITVYTNNYYIFSSVHIKTCLPGLKFEYSNDINHVTATTDKRNAVTAANNSPVWADDADLPRAIFIFDARGETKIH